jgi:hypothetical protein
MAALPTFFLAGVIDRWDGLTRQLEIAGQACWVAPDVEVWDMQAGRWARAVGYRDDRTDRRIVTHLTLG